MVRLRRLAAVGATSGLGSRGLTQRSPVDGSVLPSAVLSPGHQDARRNRSRRGEGRNVRDDIRDRPLAVVEQQFSEVRADEPRTAGDECRSGHRPSVEVSVRRSSAMKNLRRTGLCTRAYRLTLRRRSIGDKMSVSDFSGSRMGERRMECHVTDGWQPSEQLRFSPF